MARLYTTDSLIKDLKRRAAIPISQQTFTDQDLVDYLNDEMISTVVPLLMDYREEYFVAFKDFNVDGAENSTVRIPSEAIGSRLREVSMVDIKANGEVDMFNLPMLSLEQVSSGLYGSTNRSGITGFYIEGDTVQLYPRRGWGKNTLRLHYFKRTPQLVLVANAGRITAVDTVNNRVTLDNIPISWSAGRVVDIIHGKPSFDIVLEGLAILSISGADVSFPDVSTLEIGDYICDVGESVFPQLPFEGHSLLLQAAKVVILEALDDRQNLEIAVKKYEKMETHFMKTVTPRVDGQAKKITSSNNIFTGRNNEWLY